MSWNNKYREWLSEKKSLENAQKVVDYLYTDDKDWSKESICGLLGNMRHESSVNPNMYEYGYSWGADRGFGLVQWTPRSKYWNWGSKKGYSEQQLRSGDAQLARIDYEVDNNIQWIAKSSVFNGLTFKQFRTNSKKLSVNQLTEAFMWGYERPNAQAGRKSLPDRQAFARKCMDQLDWSGSGGGNGEDPKPDPDDPPSDPIYDFDNIVKFLKDFGKTLHDEVKKMLIVNLYDYGNSKTFGNKFLKVDETYKNIYKIKPTINFDDTITKIINNGISGIEDIIGGIVKPTPPKDPTEPDPEPDPNAKMYFPVNYNTSGINFWKRSNWGNGTLQKNMTYGNRSNGKFHAGYDIGSGGKRGIKVYAIRDCEITDIRQVSGGGYSVFMKHLTDKYHSMYLHLEQDSAVVKKGDKVKAGEQIAVMGNTGGNYAIHLHVEISPTGNFHTDANTIDPEKYLKVTDDNKTSLPSPE